MSERAAVLLLAHGTPDTLDEIPEYLRNITGGRPLPDSVVEEIRHRYSLIGASPLTQLTLEQGRLLAEELGMPVYVGMRNWKPYIADVVARMREDGITKIVAICLAPQNSRTSVGLYRRALFAASGAMRIEFINGWADHPLLADAFAERLRIVLEPFQLDAGQPIPVLFTAHSVPCRTIQTPAPSDTGAALDPDPYAVEAKRTAALVAERAGVQEDQWCFAFQSQGMSGGPWIGPTVEDTLTALHQQGAGKIVLQPIGFLCDHVEILYDIDIAFREFANKLQMELKRPESLNDSPLLIAALADLARKGLERLA
ncbi:ferrochelatase [Silvibacterium bohemicum]|uniref:Ferrochelatase n=1 Tax=Silvibacterium bohemicum TaxID=1577686 RepID=A0A841K2Z4_9BACT|nr:ferrochelatase [Silvibacterium bohemicum]MBB6144624.1 ferrochelatase [Silvibacterium bohemicum]